MILKQIKYLGKDLVLICDEKCEKAFGINNRPKIQLSDDEDDYEWLSDNELKEAPMDTGICEGGQSKPINKNEVLNKWCCRECERSRLVNDLEYFELPDFNKRIKNIGESING
jgi:hypothetical protein